MKKFLLISCMMCLIAASSFAQKAFSDSLSISLLTCSMGPDSFERFGHSGIRIYDLKTGQDIVFHWGVYNFHTPHFVLKFIKGITDYQIGACYTEYFFEDYRERGLAVTEQKLDLDSTQVQSVLATILENYKPENRKYRYNYFFDNCATRPFHILNNSTNNAISYDTAWVKPITLRDMLQEKTGKNNWLDFGISLAVAQRSDKVASFTEQMFLPSYLSKAIENASINGHKLVEGDIIQATEMSDEVKAEIDDQPLVFSPMSVMCFVFILVLVLTVIQLKKKSQSLRTVIKSIDTILLVATGITGSIIWFLNFFSLHPAVDHNINCLWLLPTNIFFAVLIWLKSPQKVNRIYFFIIFAAIIAYALINIVFVHQYYCPGFAPAQLTLLLMCWHESGYFGNKKV